MKSRYWDAEWDGLLIKFKKGKGSIWLDLVRYSEILLKYNADASRETIMLFFVPTTYTKDFIEEIIMIETKALIEKVRLTEEIAKSLIELNAYLPRSFNAQASLTKNDVKEISRWIV